MMGDPSDVRDGFLTLSALGLSSTDLHEHVMFSNQSNKCLRQLDHRVEVWRRHQEHNADCCTDSVKAFGEGEMVCGGNSLTGKTIPVLIGANLNPERYQDQIQQPVPNLDRHSLELTFILQDDNA